MALGIDWELQTSPNTNIWRDLTHTGAQFVAVAFAGVSGFRVATSPDGELWTARATPENNQWHSVKSGGGNVVAVSVSGTNRVMRSTDGGDTWAPASAAEANNWRGLTFAADLGSGSGRFVAVASSGTNRVMYSDDGGATWTAASAATALEWRNITRMNGLFVAVAGTGTGNRVMTSPDGIVWTSRVSAADELWHSVTNDGVGLFVAVSESVGTQQVMTSPDGIAWTLSNTPVSLSGTAWHDVTHGAGLFVATGVNESMESPDGFAWTARTTPSGGWLSVAHGAGIFVSASNDGVTLSFMALLSQCTILGDPARYISEDETTTGTRLLTDDEYRLFIKARIAKNQSKGNINSLVDLIVFIVGSGGFILFDGPGVAEFTVGFDVGTLSANDKVFISQSDLLPKPAGVKLNLFEYPANGAFGYVGAPGDIAGYDVGQYIDTF